MLPLSMSLILALHRETQARDALETARADLERAALRFEPHDYDGVQGLERNAKEFSQAHEAHETAKKVAKRAIVDTCCYDLSSFYFMVPGATYRALAERRTDMGIPPYAPHDEGESDSFVSLADATNDLSCAVRSEKRARDRLLSAARDGKSHDEASAEYKDRCQDARDRRAKIDSIATSIVRDTDREGVNWDTFLALLRKPLARVLRGALNAHDQTRLSALDLVLTRVRSETSAAKP